MQRHERFKYYLHEVATEHVLQSRNVISFYLSFFYIEFIEFPPYLYSICTVALNNWKITIFDIV